MNAKQIFEIITEIFCPNPEFEKIIISGISQDSRKIKDYQLFAAIKGENFDGHSFLKQCLNTQVSLAIVDKNSEFFLQLPEKEKDKCIAVENVTDALRKLAKHFRKNFPFPVIGIGGSNGKTTTKELLYSMLLSSNNKVTKTNKSENGYLGMAITLLQESHNNEHHPNTLVLEIGIDEIGAMQKHVDISTPDIALLTALGPEHLTGLKDWDTAIKEELILFGNSQHAPKHRIWQLYDDKIAEYYYKITQSKELILDNDFIVIEKNKYELHNKKIINSNSHHINKNEIIWEIIEESPTNTVVQIEFYPSTNSQYAELKKIHVPLPGKHNASNFALAFAAALCTGLSPDNILNGFKNFIAPPMRSNIKMLKNSVTLYNDAYNSSPLSLQAALDSIDTAEWKEKQKLVVLGDMLGLGDESNYWHEKLIPSLIKLKNTHLCLYGSAMYICYKSINGIHNCLLKENGTHVFWLDQNEDPKLFFSMIDFKFHDCLVLVKGSRGMRLERIVQTIEEV